VLLVPFGCLLVSEAYKCAWYADSPATEIRGNATILDDRHELIALQVSILIGSNAQLYLELVDSGMNHRSR